MGVAKRIGGAEATRPLATVIIPSRDRTDSRPIDSHAEDKAISDRMTDRRLGYQKIEGDWNGQCITTKNSLRAATLPRKTARKGSPKALLVLRGNFRSYDADRGSLSMLLACASHASEAVYTTFKYYSMALSTLNPPLPA
jgi:hypothetical protein